jgi:hypothetical protein
MSSQDQELLRVISEVLHYVWDPIRVAGIPQARNEYDTYVGPVFTLLQSGATEAQIAQHLEKISSERITLSAKSDEAASVLVDWREFLSGDGV